jgi:hypothetical protein
MLKYNVMVLDRHIRQNGICKSSYFNRINKHYFQTEDMGAPFLQANGRDDIMLTADYYQLLPHLTVQLRCNINLLD